MVAEDDDPWSAKRSGFQRSRSLDVTMMDTLSKYGGGSQSGYVLKLRNSKISELQCWTEGRRSTAEAEDFEPTATAMVAEV